MSCGVVDAGQGWTVGKSGSAAKMMLNWVFYGAGDRSWGATTLCSLDALRHRGEEQQRMAGGHN